MFRIECNDPRHFTHQYRPIGEVGVHLLPENLKKILLRQDRWAGSALQSPDRKLLGGQPTMFEAILPQCQLAVSYTHLTLPTKLEV